ncbi:MAG: enoyl-CoA hydratase/isomerase family protein [Planctomycetota bacterium]
MQFVDVKVHDTTATLTLDRPSKRNALSRQTLDDFQLAVSDLHQEKRVRSVIMIGKGTDFCAGLDLSELASLTGEQAEDQLSELHSFWGKWSETLEQLLRFPKPVIAAVDGSVLGAGLALALACDVIVSSDRARFAANAPERGLVGATTAALLGFRLGGSMAARLSLIPESIDASEAFRIGLTAQVTTSDQIWVEAQRLGELCAAVSPQALAATKRTLNEGIGEAMLSQLYASAATSATATSTPWAEEGVAAFLEKRHPKWD